MPDRWQDNYHPGTGETAPGPPRPSPVSGQHKSHKPLATALRSFQGSADCYISWHNTQLHLCARENSLDCVRKPLKAVNTGDIAIGYTLLIHGHPPRLALCGFPGSLVELADSILALVAAYPIKRVQNTPFFLAAAILVPRLNSPLVFHSVSWKQPRWISVTSNLKQRCVSRLSFGYIYN